MAPIIPVAGGVVAGLFRTLVSKQVNIKNYAKIKDLVNTLSRYIKDGKLRLTKTQNKAFNQQKNELTRFESRFRARTVPTKLKENVLPFKYKKSMKQEFKEMGKSDDAIKSRLEGMNKITRDRLNRRRFEKAVKTEKEKMSKDPDYIQDIIDPDDFKLASGGIAGQLHLNQGGRIGYKHGTRKGYIDYVLAMNALGLTPMSGEMYSSLSPIMSDQEMINMGSPDKKAKGGLARILGV